MGTLSSEQLTDWSASPIPAYGIDWIFEDPRTECSVPLRARTRDLELCAPILFTGGSFRKEMAQAKPERLKSTMERKELP